MKAYAICMTCLTVVENERMSGWGNVPNHYCVECGTMNFKSLRDYLKEREVKIAALEGSLKRITEWIATVEGVTTKITANPGSIT